MKKSTFLLFALSGFFIFISFNLYSLTMDTIFKNIIEPKEEILKLNPGSEIVGCYKITYTDLDSKKITDMNYCIILKAEDENYFEFLSFYSESVMKKVLELLKNGDKLNNIENKYINTLDDFNKSYYKVLFGYFYGENQFLFASYMSSRERVIGGGGYNFYSTNTIYLSIDNNNFEEFEGLRFNQEEQSAIDWLDAVLSAKTEYKGNKIVTTETYKNVDTKFPGKYLKMNFIKL